MNVRTASWQLVMYSTIILVKYSGASDFLRFKRHSEDDFLLLHRYKTEEDVALVACCIKCFDDGNCTAINYQKDEETCELNDNNIYSNYVSEKADGWNVYSIIRDTGNCPSNWTLHNTSCYYVGEDRVDWYTSLDNCRAHGGYLVEINDAAENAFVSDMLNKLQARSWLGGSDLVAEGNWMWETSRASLASQPFQSWYSNQPNNLEGQNCLGMHDAGKWFDDDCTARQRYVCEMQI